jgi:hypothetical protein
MAKVASQLEDDVGDFVLGSDDIYVPAARRASIMSAARSAVGSGSGSHAPGARRLSSLGSLHHAGHSEGV